MGIDQGPEHVMTVWNWETEEESGKLIGKVATHQVSFAKQTITKIVSFQAWYSEFLLKLE